MGSSLFVGGYLIYILEEENKVQISESVRSELNIIYENLKITDAQVLAQDILHAKQIMVDVRDKAGKQLT